MTRLNRKLPLMDALPDVRDGLSRVERIILYVMYKAEKEFPNRTIPTAIIYGRVIEHGITLTPEELSRVLARLGARRDPIGGGRR